MRATRLGLGQFEAGVLELEHALAEGLAFARVVDGLLQKGFDGGGGAHGHHQALLRQLLHQVLEALVLLAQKIAHRHAPGIRLMTTMLHALEDNGQRFGLQSMCEAGGMANATIIERL